MYHIVLRHVYYLLHYCPLNAGLWKAWFLPMMRGEMLPKMPTEPPVLHIRAGETVPYTPEEQAERTAAYKIKKATWDKTMKVIYVCGLCYIMHY